MHLATLDNSGALRRSIDVPPQANQNISGASPLAVVGSCIDLVHMDVVIYNQPDANFSAVQQFCPSACP